MIFILPGTKHIIYFSRKPFLWVFYIVELFAIKVLNFAESNKKLENLKEQLEIIQISSRIGVTEHFAVLIVHTTAMHELGFVKYIDTHSNNLFIRLSYLLNVLSLSCHILTC